MTDREWATHWDPRQLIEEAQVVSETPASVPTTATLAKAQPLQYAVGTTTVTVELDEGQLPPRDSSPEAEVAHRILEGAQLVVLDEVLVERTNEHMRSRRSGNPPLTVAPVGTNRIYCRVREGRDVTLATRPFRHPTRNPSTGWSLTYRDRFASRGSSPISAIVPAVPERYEDQVRKGDLILFEPDWRNEPRPVHHDPALLRQVHGRIYEILAMWDVSPNEWDAVRANLMRRAAGE